MRSLTAWRKDPTTRSFITEGTGTLIIRVGGAALALSVQLVLARVLAVEEFGRYAYALSWLSLTALIAILGLDGAGVLFVASYIAKKDWPHLAAYLRWSRKLGLSVGLGIASAVLAALALLAWSGHTAGGLVWVLAAGILPLLLGIQVSGSWIQGLGRPIFSQFAQGVARPLLLGIFLLVGCGLLGLPRAATTVMGANLLASGVTFLILYGVWRRLRPAELLEATMASTGDLVQEVELQRWWPTAWAMLLMAASQLLLSQADVLMIGLLRDSTEAGIYAVASQLADLVIFGITAVNLVLAPTIAGLYAKGEREALQRVLTTASRYLLLLCLPAAAVLGFGGEWILGFYGEEFKVAHLALAVLLAGELSIALAGSVGSLLTMTGHAKLASRIVLGSVALNLVLNAVLIPRYGLVGAAAATSAATLTRTVLMSVAVRRLLGLDPTFLGTGTRTVTT